MDSIIKNIKWFFRQLRRSLAYFKHSWGGYDWDHGYAIDMFKYSLQRLHDNLNSDQAYSLDAKQNARRLKTIIELMDKVKNEEYAIEYQKQLEDIYGDNVLDWHFEDTGKGDHTSFFKWEYEKWNNADEVRKLHNELFEASNKKQERAHKLMWCLIEHNIRKMWD